MTTDSFIKLPALKFWMMSISKNLCIFDSGFWYSKTKHSYCKPWLTEIRFSSKCKLQYAHEHYHVLEHLSPSSIPIFRKEQRITKSLKVSIEPKKISKCSFHVVFLDMPTTINMLRTQQLPQKKITKVQINTIQHFWH